MTSRSRRKHPITALSIASKARKPLVVDEPSGASRRQSSIVISASFALVLTAGLTTAHAAPPEKESGIKAAISSPIKWLRDRSARKRWEKQKAEELLRQAEQQQAGSGNVSLEDSTIISGPGPLTFSGDVPFQNASDQVAQPSAEVAPYEPIVSPNFGSSEAAADYIEAGYQDTASDPKQLRPITEILPYADYRPEMKVETGIDPTLKAPKEVELSQEVTQPRQMDAILYQWQASNLYHYPLYFEDPSLERYGHAHDELVQPFVSMGQFGLQLVGLPYQMTIDPVCKKRYALGWFRPGECAPKQVKQIPWNTKAAINQTAVTTGMWFALP